MSGGSDAADAPSPAPAEAAAAAAAGRAARFAAPAAPLTEYELEREAQIKRNSAKLAALNLPKLAPTASPRAGKRKAVRRPHARCVAVLRRLRCCARRARSRVRGLR
jgi:ABC-type uncharacterized transport system auxiliary subunit